MKAFYNSLCINCKGSISDSRLKTSGLCDNCLEEDIKRRDLIVKRLTKRGNMKEYGILWDFWRKCEEFSEFFEKIIGNKMWTLQEFWMKRLLKEESLAIVAPTGIGKTSFGIVACLYLASKGKRCYIILPTSLLVEHVRSHMETAVKRLGLEVNIAFYHSGLRGKEKKEKHGRDREERI